MARKARKTAPEEMPDDPSDAVAPAGHNKPPGPSFEMTAEEWRAWMEHVFEALTERRDQLVASFERFRAAYPTIPDDDVQGRAGDLRDKILALVKQATATHTIEKAPILTAQRAVDGYYKAFLSTLETRDSKGKLVPRAQTAINVIVERCTAYALKKEEERRQQAAAEAQRLADEAAAKAAEAAKSMDAEAFGDAAEAAKEAEDAAKYVDAPAAEMSRTYGPLGSVSSLRTRWTFVEAQSDLTELAKAVVAGKAPIEYLDFNHSRISIAVRSEQVRTIPGCAIIEVKSI